MFCKFCGKEVSNNAVFCEKCGKKLSDDIISVTHQNSSPDFHNKTERGSFVAQAKFNPRSMIGSVIFAFILLFAFIAIVVWSDSMRFYDILYKQKDFLHFMGILGIIGAIITIICDFISIAINSNIKCTAYENMIAGTAVNSRFSMTKVSFSFTYDEVQSAVSNKRIITILANGTSYIVAASSIPEAERMVSIIDERRPKRISSIFKDESNLQKAGSNEWKCSNCGRINQNYVGTCGCGKPKP